MPYSTSTRWYPFDGKTAALRAVLEERVRAQQAAGLMAQLSSVSYGPEWPCLIVFRRHANLADFQQVNEKVASANAATVERTAQVGRAGQNRLTEILQQTNPGGSTG